MGRSHPDRGSRAGLVRHRLPRPRSPARSSRRRQAPAAHLIERRAAGLQTACTKGRRWRASVTRMSSPSTAPASTTAASGLWMEFVRGVTLEQMLASHGPFSAGEAGLAGYELCGALDRRAPRRFGASRRQGSKRDARGGRTAGPHGLRCGPEAIRAGHRRRAGRGHTVVSGTGGVDGCRGDDRERHLQPRSVALPPGDQRLSREGRHVRRSGPRPRAR